MTVLGNIQRFFCRAQRAAALKRTTSASKRATQGFTLIELLAALLIVTVLGTMVVTAMQTGSRVMATSTAGANASVLEQSLHTALSDALRYASVHANGQSTVDNPTFDSDSYYDFSGAPVRNGRILITEGKLALETASGVQFIPKSSGIYTDFVMTDFQLSYDSDSNVFSGTYTLSLPDGSFTRNGEFSCRSLVEETV